jgi:molybdenum cofactor sulfurtransferase
VSVGLDVLEQIGMQNIQLHVSELSWYLAEKLADLRHKNGNRLVKLHSTAHSGIVTFSLRDDQGRLIGYSDVVKFLSNKRIYVRGGCVCNPGACAHFLGITDDILRKAYGEKDQCADSIDILDGVELGAVRASFGYWNTLRDCDTLVKGLKHWLQCTLPRHS